jgi:hypothetical protein
MEQDPIYIEHILTRGNYFDIYIEIGNLSLHLERANMNDIRNFVDKFYNDESVILTSYGTNILSFLIQHDTGIDEIWIRSIPMGISLYLSRSDSELLVEKFSRLLNDHKNKL